MKKNHSIIISAFVVIAAIFWIYPIFVIALNSFKSYNMMIQDFFGFPKNPGLKMYKETWSLFKFPMLLKNTFIYTMSSVIGVVLLAPMAAYKLSRTKSVLSNIFFLVIILPVMVPFQAYMISLTKFGSILKFSGTGFGYVLTNIGLNLPFAVFMTHGFVKTIPKELDECATIDGASQMHMYFAIILPLLVPIITTTSIIIGLGVWNDIIVNILIVGGKESLRNLQTSLYARFSTQQSDWEHALPGLIMSIIPNIVFFLTMQKYIVDGIAAGAVKG